MPAGVSYGVYPEISNLPPNNVTYYKWSNDNGVYTELAHPGLIELGGAYLVLFQGEQAALDNSKVRPARPGPGLLAARGRTRVVDGLARAREGLCGETTIALRDRLQCVGRSAKPLRRRRRTFPESAGQGFGAA